MKRPLPTPSVDINARFRALDISSIGEPADLFEEGDVRWDYPNFNAAVRQVLLTNKPPSNL